jgi:hypothetical protein
VTRNRAALILLTIVAGLAHGDPHNTDARGTDTVDTRSTCTKGCERRAHGYACAEQQDIDDVDDCVGPSPAFVDGCKTYVEENRPSVYNGDGRF